MDNHLNIREIRQSIERYVAERPDSSQRQQQNDGKNEKPIACTDFNNAGKHFTFLPSR